MEIRKGMTNLEIADLLRDVSAAYEIKGENRFKIVAYDRAADAIEHLSSELKDIWQEKSLDDVPGVGKSIAEHLSQIFAEGKSDHFEKVFEDIPESVFEMIKVPGIGPKNAIKFASNLNIESANTALAKLLKSAKDGEIAKMPGFGEDSQNAIIKSLEEFSQRGEKRMLISEASEISDKVFSWMKKSSYTQKIEVLGSTRRREATVGDIDFAVASSNAEKTIEHFTNFPDASRVLEKGVRTASFIVPPNIQVDLMVESKENFGSLLQHFTGSKHHNIALREYAIKNTWKVSDYGITKNGKLIKIDNEKDFYKELKMDWIPPELRQDRGEIEAAIDHKLPELVELKDIKGDLHIHSSFDIETSHDIGDSSMEEIAKKASELGYEYIAFTEHNPSQSKHTQKEINKLLTRKKSKINTLNEVVKKGVKIFNSLEIDILPSGELPISKENLELLDFAIVSVHSSFKQTRDAQTRRVISALSHPKVKIFAHPTARKINEREGIDLDWEKIFSFMKENNKFLEINSSPERLDLPDFLVYEARKKGIKFVVSTDTHTLSHLDNMKYGIYVARRGWCEKHDIVNTQSLALFESQMGL